MTRHGSHTESRMRENCTYGSMRGRAYPITRGDPLYSTHRWWGCQWWGSFLFDILCRMRERRHFRTDWCYHLISRIAHRAFFLTEDERTRFVDLLRRAAAFSGVEVLAYCFMTNHFHILVYVPPNCARHSGSGARTSSRRATCRRWKRPVSSGSPARRTASHPISCSS